MEQLVLSKREKRKLAGEYPDLCLTCGTCAGGCPVTGVDGMDMRKAVRMALLGLDQELIDSRFPWICTICGRCEHGCPMNIDLNKMMRSARTHRERDKVPGVLHKGVEQCLKSGNNVGIPKEDYLFLLEDLGLELAEELPGFEVPVDKKGARIMLTINSKEPFAEPEDMFFWWKIFYAAKESWTVTSENWEGVNWGLFTGDDDAMKEQVRRIVENYKKLECEILLLPEWGHAYYATRLGLQQWFADEGVKFMSVHDLMKEYIETGRIKIDKSKHPELTTYHDPCNYARKSERTFGHGYYEEPRWITQQCVDNYVDMYPNRANNYCCGAGGGAWAAPYAEERIYYGRVKAKQIKDTGAEMLIAPCHNCRDQIMKSLRQEFDMMDLEVKYLWELVADSLVIEGVNDKEE